MSRNVAIDFIALKDVVAAGGKAGKAEAADTIVVFAGEGAALSANTAKLTKPAAEQIKRAVSFAKFKGKTSSSIDLLAPHGLSTDRLLIIGTAPGKDASAPQDFPALGGFTMGKLAHARHAVLVLDQPDFTSDAAADVAMGIELRAYNFDTYKSKKKDDDEAKEAAAPIKILIACADPVAARREHKSRASIASGVKIARTLVNEPPNVLTPVEFARRAKELTKLGVEIDILDEKAMTKLGMGALLGVGQGSDNESRVVIMRWNGAKSSKAKPVAFVGKGVTFDTGGISIKPAGGMEDMKGDMAGAACVVGLMHALASRKAKVNVVGAIGLVENMPGANAQRPGDIVTTMSGQTIEIINTDAEGRLVLADVLWYVQDKYKPTFIVNLATLTGAILVALGQEYAGLFSNNDELSTRLTVAGTATGEKVWRMPMGPAFDKMIDSKFADMKNTGGRFGGSITAAQLLQRFVNNVPWAHLDIAGTGMSSPSSDINQSWGSGWGVRLLNKLVADHYE